MASHGLHLASATITRRVTASTHVAGAALRRCAAAATAYPLQTRPSLSRRTFATACATQQERCAPRHRPQRGATQAPWRASGAGTSYSQLCGSAAPISPRGSVVAGGVQRRHMATQGWQPSPFVGKLLKGALKVFGYYGGAATRERYSWLLFQSVADQAGQDMWFKGMLGLPDDFRTRHSLLMLHSWMVHQRMKQEYDNGGKEMIEQFFDRVWEDSTRRVRTLGVPEITVNKHLKELQQHSFGAMVHYDEGLLRTDDKEHFFGSALWRNVFERQPKSDEHVALLAAYCRREVAALNKVPIVDVYAGLIPWGPAVGESKEARAERQQAIHAGEWRTAISEGGEMYYWHTATRETSWTKPEAMEQEEARRQADIAKWEALNNSGASGAEAEAGAGTAATDGGADGQAPGAPSVSGQGTGSGSKAR